MSISREEVEYVARLARLKLAREEQEEFTGQLQDILSYMDRLQEISTEEVEPAAQPGDPQTFYREDEVADSLSRGEVFANAPDSDGECFRVPRIFEDESQREE